MVPEKAKKPSSIKREKKCEITESRTELCDLEE